MVEITNEMRMSAKARRDQVFDAVDRSINEAAKKKLCSAYFPCDRDRDADVYDSIRQAYERAGYRIVPTGFSGGVWQRTENIVW